MVIATCEDCYPALPLPKQAEIFFKNNTKLEASMAAATQTVEPIEVTEDPLDKDFTTVTSKCMDEISGYVELRKAKAPS